MLHALNILAVHGDDSGSQLIWVIAVLVMSAIGAIAGKIREKSQKPPPGPIRPPERPADEPESDEEEYTVLTPRPAPPRPREPSSRPMPRVPRGPKPGGDRPIGIPRPVGRIPLPGTPRPAPTPSPVLRRPAERPVSEPYEPRPVRPGQPAVAALTSKAERPRAPLSEGSGPRSEATVAAPRRKRASLLDLRLTPDQLRQAIVLKEVLGPPVSMREDDRQF